MRIFVRKRNSYDYRELTKIGKILSMITLVILLVSIILIILLIISSAILLSVSLLLQLSIPIFILFIFIVIWDNYLLEIEEFFLRKQGKHTKETLTEWQMECEAYGFKALEE